MKQSSQTSSEARTKKPLPKCTKYPTLYEGASAIFQSKLIDYGRPRPCIIKNLYQCGLAIIQYTDRECERHTVRAARLKIP